MRVAVKGGRLERLVVLENTLQFGADGWANADHLTAAEVERLRQFHFMFEGEADVEPPLFVDAPLPIKKPVARPKSARK